MVPYFADYTQTVQRAADEREETTSPRTSNVVTSTVDEVLLTSSALLPSTKTLHTRPG